MKRKKIVICEDDKGPREELRKRLLAVRAIRDQFDEEDVVSPDNSKLREELSLLENRRASARSNERTAQSQPSWFDDAEILIIDYDLININNDNAEVKKDDIFVTGEQIAYLARCYSHCGFIVALNQFGDNAFDLSLRGHPESYADLNIGASQLDNRGLWEDNVAGFRPWSWPILPEAASAFRKCVKELLKDNNLDKPLLSFLGFDDELTKMLSRSTLEFIEEKSRKADPPEKMTSRQFVLRSENGLRGKDSEKPPNVEQLAHIAAARIRLWLDSLVLPGQDILVDAPHLIGRFPSLLVGEKKRQLTTWNKAATLARQPPGIELTRLKMARFAKDQWLTRPAWQWPKLSSDQKIEEVAEPWSSPKHGDYVFCEDISRFLPREAAREFVADLPSSFVRRFVVNVDSDRKEVEKYAKVLSEVAYRPSVRFSL